MQDFNRKILFNPDGDDHTNKIWTGNPSGIMQLNIQNNLDIWNIGVIKAFDNHWRPEKVDLTDDITIYANLEEKHRTIYNSILAYLTFLDSIQVSNIPELAHRVTCPKTKAFFALQSEQEALHSHGYQQMIQTLVPENQRNDIFNLVISDKVLQKRCTFISNHYQQYLDDQTVENYYKALIANYLLEGLYFYSGFMYFYTLAEMPGTITMIKYIHKDELYHVKSYQRLLPQFKKEFKGIDLMDSLVFEMFDKAIQHEYDWCNYIMQDKVLGMSSKSTLEYLKWLSNSLLRNIGLKPMYPEVKINPYKHLDKLADLESDATSKGNFFESKITSYNMSPLEGINDDY